MITDGQTPGDHVRQELIDPVSLDSSSTLRKGINPPAPLGARDSGFLTCDWSFVERRFPGATGSMTSELTPTPSFPFKRSFKSRKNS